MRRCFGNDTRKDPGFDVIALVKGGSVTAGIRAITGIIHHIRTYFQKLTTFTGEDTTSYSPYKDIIVLARWHANCCLFKYRIYGCGKGMWGESSLMWRRGAMRQSGKWIVCVV